VSNIMYNRHFTDLTVDEKTAVIGKITEEMAA
jgi:predicted transcriptional regulator